MSGFTHKSRVALLFIAVTQFSVGSLLIGSNANPYVDEWQDLKAGMFIHFNMSTFTGKSWSTGEEDPALFNPTDLDVNSWAKAAKSGGLRYGVLTVKHHDGFALWKTKISKHDVASSPYRKDIVKEYTDAFRKNKLKVGLYYSIWDRRWDRDSSVDQVEAIKVQMRELLGGKYGTIDLLWLDGWGWQKRYSEIPYQEIREYIREISPSTVVSNNDHNYSLQTTDLLVWETAVKMPLPINAPGPFNVAEQIGRTWFYREGTVSNNKPKEYFQWIVNQVIPEGGVLTFNVGPDKSGAIPKERFTALKHIKEALRAGPIINWARTATVTQSSTAHGNGPTIAKDGKVFSLISGTVTNTNSEKEAWWEADLGTSRSVGDIQVWNRLKNGRERLRDFYVFVSTEPLESKSLSETIAQPGVKAYFHEGIADWATTFSHIGEGQYVRIQLEGEEALSLAEIRILDNPTKWIRPTITQNPIHQKAGTGAVVKFLTKYEGYPRPTIKWEKLVDRKWKTLHGENDDELILEDLTKEDSGTYRSVLSNSSGNLFSKSAKLQILDRPAFITQPTNKYFIRGKTASLQLAATGTPKLSFEWFKDGNSIGITKSKKLTLRKVNKVDHEGTYSVKVSNPVGEVTSEDFQVSVIEPVKIDANPVDAGIVSGEAGSLTVNASGGGTLSYQWVKYDAKSRKWSNVEGATSATFNITAITVAEEGRYKCLVTNGASTYFSKDADLMMYVRPTIKSQPASISQKEAGKVTLRAEALGTPLPTYQWRKLAGDGTTWEDVPKANKSTLYFSKIKKEQAGKYRLRATNAGGHIDSDAVDVVVYYAPVLTTNIASKSSVNETESLTLTVAANVLDSKGTDATYTWFKDKKALKDGGTVSGAKTAALTITGATGNDSGSYWCEIKNGVGTTKSTSSKLTVLLKPNTSKPLKSLDLAEGKNATFSASIKGGKPMTFQWYHNDAEISGQTKNKLSLRGVTTSQAGTYKLVATNPAGAFEMEATLAVTAASTYVAPVANNLEEDSPARILSQALGANPTTGQTYQPIIDTVEDGEGTTYVSFSYTENNDAVGIQYILENSADLNTWTPLDLGQASVNRVDRGSFTEVTVYIPASSSQGFFRVRVE